VIFAALMASVLSAAPMGACADRAVCRFTVSDELKEAAAGLGLVAGELKAEPLKKPSGDVAFALTSAVAAGQVGVKAVSLHRAAAVYGEASAKVMAVKKPEWKQRALVSAQKVAIAKAMEDLTARIAGVRKVTLSAQLSGLDEKGRDHVEKSLMPCLKGLFDLVGALSVPGVSAGYFDEVLEYLPEKDEPRVSLDWQVARVKAAIIGGPRAKCGVAGTSLQGMAALVTADPVNQAVVVRFKR